jgi:hypothetical protein
MIDEDGYLYCSFDSRRMVNGRVFMAGRGGTIGGTPHPRFGKGNRNPFIVTYMKTSQKGAKLLKKRALVKLDPLPTEPMHVNHGWVEGAEWLYAGAGPIVCVTCSCPTNRAHLDWYKRSYIPEPFRHSFGVLDANGNLILHLGEYGNYDSGKKIASSAAPYTSGTDNYFAYIDYSRLVVVKLDCHAEERAQIRL